MRATLADFEHYDPEARKDGDQRRYLCPFCGHDKPNDDSHRSVSLEAKTGLWHCWRCGKKGKVGGDDYREPRPLYRPPLFAPAHTDADAPSGRTRKERETDWRALSARSVPVTGTPGEAYLLGRGITAREGARAKVRFLLFWYGRPAVLFPVRDFDRNLVAVQGRYLDGADPKTRTKGAAAAGIFETPGAWDADPLIIVEGPFDALSLYSVGFPAIAAMGCKIPTWLPGAVSGRDVVIASDYDRPIDGIGRPGENAAREWFASLTAAGARPTRLYPPEGKDWNDWLTSNRGGLRVFLTKQGIEPKRQHTEQ